VGGGGGERRKDGHGPNPYSKFLNSPLLFTLGGMKNYAENLLSENKVHVSSLKTES